MTKSVDNTPPTPEPEKPNPIKRVVNKLRSSPKKTTAGVAAIAAFGALGYWGTQVLVKQKLPPFLETQIGNFIDRPVELGEVKSFSFNSIEFGASSLPPKATDPDRVSLDGIKVGFNILPVLFRRTLPLEITLINPDVYLEQEADGEWVDLAFLQSDEEKKDPLIYFDVEVNVEDGDIVAVPYQQSPLQIKVDGSGRYNQAGEQLVAYDLDAAIEQAKATIKGETILGTGETDTKLLVKDLALSDVATLIPNSPVNLNSGRLNADLDINIPSLEEITSANVKGEVSLSQVAGEVPDLDASVRARSQLDFNGRDALVKETQASLGNIVARVDGRVNLDTGYDLEVRVLPFSLSSLPQGITQQLPVPVAGAVTAQLQLRGAIKEPLLTGKINNTQRLTVDKTQLEQIVADFSADLDEFVLKAVKIVPVAGGEVTAQGKVETNLRKVLDSEQTESTVKMPLDFNFEAKLPTQELVNPYYQLPSEVAVGNLNARGEITGTVDNPQATIQWQIPEAATADVEDISGSGKIIFAENDLSLRDTQISVGDGTVDVTAQANLDSKQWQAAIAANDLYLTPFLTQFESPNLNLDRPIALDNGDVRLNGKLDNLNLNQIQATANLNFDVDGGDVAVNSQLNSGNLRANAKASSIALNRFVPALPVTTTLRSSDINAAAKLEQLLNQENPNLNSLTADADLNLAVNGEAVRVNSELNSGIIQARATTDEIDLNQFVSNLPVPAKVRSSRVNASGRLEQLLTFADNPNLSSVDATVDADLTVAEGTVKAIAGLNNNQWRANIDANDISSKLLLERFAPENLASVEIDNINARAELTGDINPIIGNEVNVPIAVNQVAIRTGEQNLNASGNLTLSNITTNFDVANANLDINADINFDKLPVDQLIAQNLENDRLLAESINIAGRGIFNGQFQGQQLISAPTQPGNLLLTGDLRLEDFAFNEIAFDPVMTGTVRVQPQTEIALNLTGEQDVIAVAAVPCTASNCRLPYLPTNLELRQGEDTQQPVIAVGERNGEIFSLDINNFPLALLNLAPGKAAGIEGVLAGKTTGEIDANLYTFATEGNITVEQPAVGYIQADRFAADFNYDPERNLAEVTTASLALDNSKYILQAALDLQSGAIDGKLEIPEAYIQDALTTFRWFTIEDVTDLFNIPDYAEAAAVKPPPEKETVGETIAEKIDLLRRINSQIQANAAEKEASGIPTSLDIQGRYFGEIALGGTIQAPQAAFRVEGNNWQWQPQPAYVDIVEPLGLVKEEAQFIAIPQLLIQGDLQGTTVDLEIATLQVEDAVLSLAGKLSPDGQNANFKVENLTVDTIGKFVNIPVDLAGTLDAEGTIVGTLPLPNLAGEITFSEGAFDGNVLPTVISGNFDYNGERLAFDTSQPDSIQIDATVPYPIIPGQSDRLSADVQLQTEAFNLLGALSQNYLNWIGGEANATLQADARLDLNREGVIYDLNATGEANLDDALININTPFFSEPFRGTGKITIDNQIVNVETLDGTFADKNLSVTGKLPILTAVNNLDNPLTVTIPKGKIDIDKLYSGGLQGEVLVTGAALTPVIGGKVSLTDGTVSIPQTQKETEQTILTANNPVQSPIPTQANSTTSETASNQPASSTFVTALNDLQVQLEDFKLQQIPVYEFSLTGDLTLNGTIDQPSNIIPDGTLELTSANVDVLSSSFSLVRNRENTIVFTPEAGIFNPTLDIQIQTEISEFDEGVQADNLRVAESGANEINDPLSQGSDNGDLITVFLNIDGEAIDILPNLATASPSCNVRADNAALTEHSKYYSEAELNQLTDCFNQASLRAGDYASAYPADRQIINSPAVELTSIPSRSQGEIVSLLGNEFLSFAEQFNNSSQSNIFDVGVSRFVIEPIQKSIFNRVDEFVVDAGKEIGLDYLRVYPYLEGIYEINKDSSVRSTYNYILNEIRIEYDLDF